MSTPDHVEEVRRRCQRVLAGNWREGRRTIDGMPYAYTCPSPGHYPWQWFWDSCFTAISWRRFDSQRPGQELSSLLRAQRDDGFIGHTIFWREPLSGSRRYTYNVLDPRAPMTASIQPPALAWAWRISVGDPSAEQGIRRYHDWLAIHRDLDGDGLLWIVQPDESGLDASPQFDPVWGWRAHGRAGFLMLVRRNRHLGYDLRRIHAAGGPVCMEVMTNVLYNLSRLALGISSLTPALIERAYDEQRGLFRPLVRPGQPALIPATVAALSPLALPDLPEQIGRRLVEEHVLHRERFWTPVPPPSVSVSEPSFSLRDTGRIGQRLYWRGPTWINSAWLVWLGLIRLGYDEAAQMLAEHLARAILASGLREYYDPYTGSGMGAVDFGWSSLILEMLEPDPRAANSYLVTSARR